MTTTKNSTDALAALHAETVDGDALLREAKYQVAMFTNRIDPAGPCMTMFETVDHMEAFRAYLHRNFFRPEGSAGTMNTYRVHGIMSLEWYPCDADRDGGDPRPGGLATFTTHTDTAACDVTKVTKTTALLRERTPIMIAKGTFHPGGFAAHCSHSPVWVTIPNFDGRLRKVSRRVVKGYRGRPDRVVWKATGHRTCSPGCSARFGVAHYHYDYNF